MPFRKTLKASKRNARLQVMLSDTELKVVDVWRFEERMPSRAAAIRALVKRGLEASGVDLTRATEEIDEMERVAKSDDIGIV